MQLYLYNTRFLMTVLPGDWLNNLMSIVVMKNAPGMDL